MPAIRSDLRKSRKIRRFSNLFSAKRPEWDNELDDEIIPTSKLGAGPFENISEADEELEVRSLYSIALQLFCNLYSLVR